MKAVIFGASKGMGRALARLMASRGDSLFLLGRDLDDLNTTARDMEIRGAPSPVGTAHCDLLKPESFASALDEAAQALDGFDTVVVTAGLFATQEEMEDDAELTARVLTADFTGTVLFCEEARKRLLAVNGLSGRGENTGATAGLSSSAGDIPRKNTAGQASSGTLSQHAVKDGKGDGKGDRHLLCEAPEGPCRQKVPVPFSTSFSTFSTLCVFSSVAGERGRKPVILYGAAKAGLSQYLEGLDHKFRSKGLKTICVKPGFVKTGMTAGLKPPPFAGEPDAVAHRVLRAIDRGRPVVYAPGAWRWVMCVIRKLPRFVMRKINF